MHKRLVWIGLLLIMAMGVSMVSAGDDSTPKPGTPDDNECNPGGVLYREENQDGCPTLWYWKAGWFLARYNRGLISRDDFPKEFESVLPPLPGSSCWNLSKMNYSVLYTGPANTLGNVIGFAGQNCTGSSARLTRSAVIFAGNSAAGQAICSNLGPVLAFGKLIDYGYVGAPGDAYGCDVN